MPHPRAFLLIFQRDVYKLSTEKAAVLLRLKTLLNGDVIER